MKKYVMPFLYTIGILLIGTLITSTLYYFNILSDKMYSIFLYLISIIGILMGSIKFSKLLNKKGFINGTIYFLILFILMIVISLIIFKSKISTKSIIYYFILLIFSILGGIIGKNTKKENDVI
ncbi:MAG: TIGR04086 family membrane protein [Bacilli bacterium]|nr:TIGR04086 family membrane protein [Bacilli bacterium]